jgi:hypothetical protein
VNTRINALLAVALLGLIGCWWHQSRELRELKTRSALASQVESANRKATVVARHGRGTEIGGQGEIPVIGPSSADHSAGGPVMVFGTIVRQATEEGRRLALARKSPEFAALQDVRDRREARVLYGRLLRKLELDPAAEEKLIRMLCDRKHVPDDVDIGIQLQRKALAGQDILQISRDANRAENDRINAEIKELIGADRFVSYEKYVQHLGAELLTAEIQQLCAVLDDALSPAQAEALANVLVQNPVSPKEAVATVAPVLNREAASIDAGQYKFVMLAPGISFVDSSGVIAVNYPITAAAAAKTGGILSASQQAVLEALRRKQTADQQLAVLFNVK